jgi:predicted acyltransferase
MDSRNKALDAIRGYAIVTMVFSGSIAYGGVLPAFMYHAQSPPPKHEWVENFPGITWVDLVFPLFLFAMGAAIPMSMQKGMDWQKQLKRFGLLVFFAIFFEHSKYSNFSQLDSTVPYLIALTGFLSLFLIMGTKKIMYQSIGLGLALLLVIFAPFDNQGHFELNRSDVIILVLANMALIGAVIYHYTRQHHVYRLLLLVPLYGLITGRFLDESWNQYIYEPYFADWLIEFNFLKYLFMVIPGIYAGEWLMKKTEWNQGVTSSISKIGLAWLCLGLVVWNIIALYNRWLMMNLFISLAVMLLILVWQIRFNKENQLDQRLLLAGCYLLICGLFFEAFEGGIKKDDATLSYFFVTGGMAFFLLFAFDQFSLLTKLLAPVGQNPLLAYALPGIFLLPLIDLTGLGPWYDGLEQTAFQGILHGLVIVLPTALLAALATKYRIFWKS